MELKETIDLIIKYPDNTVSVIIGSGNHPEPRLMKSALKKIKHKSCNNV
jgi:hypothetical protein